MQGIHVQDFSIGFGPTLFSTKDRDGIQYTLRALPLGGYVAFPSASEEVRQSHAPVRCRGCPKVPRVPDKPALCVAQEEEKSEEGENEASDEGKSMEERYYAPDDPDLLENRPAIQRAFVISAGVLFNMILAWGAIFGTVVTQGVSTPTLREGVLVPQIVDANGAGARFGVQAGDIILQSDDKIFPASEEGPTSLVTAVKTSKGQTMHFVIQRGGEKLTVDMTPDVNSKGEGVMGVRLTPNIERMDLVRPESPLKAASLTNREFGRAFGQTAGGLVKLVQGFAGGQGPSNLAGPVGVMQMGAEAGRQGALLTFMALISLNLGIMNSIPLPALDGGQFLLVRPAPPPPRAAPCPAQHRARGLTCARAWQICVEAVRGKPLDQELTRTVNGLFLSMLLLVSVSLLLGDIERILPANLF